MGRTLLSLPCLIAMIACAGAQRAPSDRGDEPRVVSSQLAMRDVERTSETPGTLSQVDPEAEPEADAAAPVAQKQPQGVSRESLRQLVIPPDLQARRGAIDACYERALQDDPRLAGTLELAVQISRDGAVRKVKVRRDTVRHRGLRKCVAGVISDMRTLENVQGPEVTYPVTFGGSTSELL